MTLVRLLGPVDIVDDSGVARAPGSALRRTLLALLALRAGEVLSVDWLLEHAWSAEPPDSGARALRFHISQLRKELAPCDLIETRPGGYRLNAGAAEVDALAVEELARAARATSDRAVAADMYAQMLRTWRAEPFVDASPSAELDDEAARLAELRLTLTEEHFRACLDAGE